VNVTRTEINRAYRRRNPAKVRAWKAASAKRNRDAENARKRRWVAANREKVRATNSAWQKANPAKCLAKTMRRKADLLRRMPVWADQAAITQVYEHAQSIRDGGFDVQVDHVIPLRGRRVSGLHVHNNLQIIPTLTNKVKANHFPS
jgi:hypothetical protein